MSGIGGRAGRHYPEGLGLAPRRLAERGQALGRTGWLLAGIVVVGALIRFVSLGQQSFWEDEAFTHAIVAHGLGHVLATVPKTESTPPLYYLLTWAWSRVFGLDEIGLRSFSAVCGVLTIPVMWSLGRRLASERIGLIAAFIAAINPVMAWYSQEARAYALLVLLSALSLLALVWALERPRNRRVACWGVVCSLALCTHYFAGFVIIPEAVWLLVALRSDGRLDWTKLALGLGPIVAMAIALAPLAIEQGQNGLADWILHSGSLPYRLALLAKEDLLGYGVPAKTLVAACGFVVAVVGLWLLRGADGRERPALALLAAIGVTGVLLPAVLAGIGKDYINTRNLLETWPAFILVVAVGYGSARARRVGTIGLGAMAALSIFCVVATTADSAVQRANWRGVARVLGRAPASTPRAIVSSRVARISLEPYMSRLAADQGRNALVREVDVVSAYGLWGGTPPPSLQALPGFRVVEWIRTSTYAVVRYRSWSGTVQAEPYLALARLYSTVRPSIVLLQAP